MKVLMVTHGFPPHGVAGVERVSEQTARELVAGGNSVSVLTRRPSHAPPTLGLVTERRGGVELYTITGGGSTFGQFPGFESELELMFERTLAAVMPDVVLISHFLHHSPRYVDLAHRWGIPVVVELHDFFVACPLAHLRRVQGDLCGGPEGGRACATHCFADQDGTDARWALRAYEFSRALEHADAVLAPSRYVAEYFERWSNGRVSAHVLPNGVAFCAPPTVSDGQVNRSLHIASIGVVIEHKGPHMVIEAIRAGRLNDVRYTLLGVPVHEYTAELHRAADRLNGLDLRVHGAFSPEELPLLLRDVDAVVVASIVPESFSIVAREAFACGVPVVAPARAGLLEAVRHGHNGLLYRPDDVSDLGRQLRDLQEDPGLLKRLAAGIRPGDWISTAERTRAMSELLEDVCKQPVIRPDAADDWGSRTLRHAVARR